MVEADVMLPSAFRRGGFIAVNINATPRARETITDQYDLTSAVETYFSLDVFLLENNFCTFVAPLARVASIGPRGEVLVKLKQVETRVWFIVSMK